MAIHVFVARVDQLVAGMDDTAVVLAEANSKEEAIGAVLEPHHGNNNFLVYKEEVWEERASTGPVHYVGIAEELESPTLIIGEVGEKVILDDQ